MQPRNRNGPPARCNQVLEPVPVSRTIWLMSIPDSSPPEDDRDLERLIGERRGDLQQSPERRNGFALAPAAQRRFAVHVRRCRVPDGRSRCSVSATTQFASPAAGTGAELAISVPDAAR